MNYGEAIEAMRNGHCVQRTGWNGKGMFVCKQNPAQISINTVPNMQSLPESAIGLFLDRRLDEGRKDFESIKYQNQMIIVKSNNTIDSWVASSSDTFAEDWKIIEPVLGI